MSALVFRDIEFAKILFPCVVDTWILLESNPRAEIYHKVLKSLLKEIDRSASLNEVELYKIYMSSIIPIIEKMGIHVVLHFKVMNAVDVTFNKIVRRCYRYCIKLCLLIMKLL